MSQAVLTSTFLGALGVNAHLQAEQGNVYTNLPITVLSADLAYLGIKSVRDNMFDPATTPVYIQSNYATLAQAGDKFDFCVASSSDLSLFMAELDAFETDHPGSVQYVEGPNEINYFPFAYQGQIGPAAAISFQRDLDNAVKHDPLLAGAQVLDFTGGGSLYAASQAGEPITGIADLPNVHLYPANGDQPAWYVPAIYRAQYGTGISGPYVVTEAGYNSDPNYTNGVSLEVQAKQTLALLLDAAQAGASTIDLYELADMYSDPGNTVPDDHWGLFNSDGSPKPVATAIHNLTAIFSDQGSSASFTPATINYSISNMPWMGHSWLLQQNGGTLDLAIWAEPPEWDTSTKTASAEPGETITVDLGNTFSNVSVFDPLLSASPILSLTDARRVLLTLTDHPLIVEFGTTAAPLAAQTSSSGVEPVYRFFDRSNGTHMFTADTAERSQIQLTRPDLVYEGVDLQALTSQVASSEPVYRFFDVNTGSHFYTANGDEEQSLSASANLVNEGIAFYEYAQPGAGLTSVYRFFDTADGSHLYTANPAERASILSNRPDLVPEGIAFYQPTAT